MFHKRKQHDSHSTSSTWQEPRMTAAAPVEADTDTSASREREAQGSAVSSKPAPRPDASAVLNRQPTPPVRPDTPRRASVPSGQGSARAADPTDSKKLTVGREISLAGEIRTCETLVVEGTVEAELNDTQMLDIQEDGLFKGAAVVDTAEVAGHFEGELTVRKRLYVRATGHVHGTIRYHNLEIESGGRVGGTLTELDADEAANAGTPSPGPARTNGAATPDTARDLGGEP